MEVRLPSICSLLASIIVTTLLACLSEAKPNVEKRCSTCRKIVTSFSEGLERTARFNFEGGDVDWEEEKLGSHATSETRFIEILETLCSRTEYECNVLVEEIEEFLEEWWSNHERENDDLERWLCIEKVSVCCPKNRYGPVCEECAGGIDRPCSGNGNCKGAGTRGGSGKCKCNGGYKGDLCEICKKGYYEAHKNETDIDCKACDTSCSSTCSGPGPKACTKCKGGYLWDEEFGCQDVDECKPDPETFPCEKEQYCKNTAGSYTCKNCDIACTECLGEGNDKCVSCRTGFNMVDNVCRDIDECEDNPCSELEHMKCSNSPGSYFCDCEDGYVSDGKVCVDKSTLTGEGESEDGDGDEDADAEGDIDDNNESEEEDTNTKEQEHHEEAVATSHDIPPDPSQELKDLEEANVVMQESAAGKLPDGESSINGSDNKKDQDKGESTDSAPKEDSNNQNNIELQTAHSEL